MDITGIDRFWFKSAIASDGRLTTTVAILTRIPLHPAEADYNEAEATRFLEEIRRYKEEHDVDVVEILRGTAS